MRLIIAGRLQDDIPSDSDVGLFVVQIGHLIKGTHFFLQQLKLKSDVETQGQTFLGPRFQGSRVGLLAVRKLNVYEVGREGDEIVQRADQISPV